MTNENKKIADNFIELLEVLRKLRSPEGCPWDQEQTSESLVPYLLEETYEIIEAIEDGDVDVLKEEIGDLTLHILFQAELARESDQFDISDSLKISKRKKFEKDVNDFLEKDYEAKVLRLIKAREMIMDCRKISSNLIEY